ASASANPISTVDAKSRQAVRPSAGCRSARLRFRIDSSATRSASNLPYDTRTLRGPYSGRLWAVEGGGRGKVAGRWMTGPGRRGRPATDHDPRGPRIPVDSPGRGGQPRCAAMRYFTM